MIGKDKFSVFYRNCKTMELGNDPKLIEKYKKAHIKREVLQHEAHVERSRAGLIVFRLLDIEEQASAIR